MDLLHVTLLIGLLVLTSPIFLSYDHDVFCYHKYHEFDEPCVYKSNGNVKHLKFLKSRIPYSVNSTSSFQLELLKSMDVNPNPGPSSCTDSDSLPNISSGHFQPPPYVYSTSTLLSLNPYQHESRLPHLPTEVWNTIKTLKLNRHPITRRRKRGGRRKPWLNPTTHQTNNKDTEHSPIPVLTTPRVPEYYLHQNPIPIDQMELICQT